MEWVVVAVPVVMAAVVVRSVIAKRAGLRVVFAVMRDCGANPTRTRGVTGCLRDATVRYDFPSSRGGPYTFCGSVWPDRVVPFKLDLRPKTAIERARARLGLAIDIGVGDPSFDAAFVVEAAPSALGRELFDEQTRAALLAFHPCRLKMSGQELSFSKEGRVQEYGQVRRLIDLSVHLWSRLESLPAEIQGRECSRPPAERGSSPPSPDARPGLDPATSAAELARLATVRERWGFLMFVAIALGFLSLIALNAMGPRPMNGHRRPDVGSTP